MVAVIKAMIVSTIAFSQTKRGMGFPPELPLEVAGPHILVATLAHEMSLKACRDCKPL
jgi:hypothetical protein